MHNHCRRHCFQQASAASWFTYSSSRVITNPVRPRHLSLCLYLFLLILLLLLLLLTLPYSFLSGPMPLHLTAAVRQPKFPPERDFLGLLGAFRAKPYFLLSPCSDFPKANQALELCAFWEVCPDIENTIGDEIITYYILQRYNPGTKRGYITVTDSHTAPREKL